MFTKTKTAVLLAGAAISAGVPADAQEGQCGGGSSHPSGFACYITNVVSSPPGGCFVGPANWSSCYASVQANCVNPSNQKSYQINTFNSLFMGCPNQNVWASALGEQGSSDLKSTARVYSYYNWAGYSTYQYVDCATNTWQWMHGKYGCYGQ